MDQLSAAKRSRLMSRVRSRDTEPEVAVRKTAHRLGLRYSLHRSDLPGKPDIVFSSRNVVIFVHGCFWHKHSKCKRATLPKTRRAFWNAKLARNVERDAATVRALRALGWRVFVVWSCQVKEPALTRRLRRIFGLRIGKATHCAKIASS